MAGHRALRMGQIAGRMCGDPDPGSYWRESQRGIGYAGGGEWTHRKDRVAGGRKASQVAEVGVESRETSSNLGEEAEDSDHATRGGLEEERNRESSRWEEGERQSHRQTRAGEKRCSRPEVAGWTAGTLARREIVPSGRVRGRKLGEWDGWDGGDGQLDGTHVLGEIRLKFVWTWCNERVLEVRSR